MNEIIHVGWLPEDTYKYKILGIGILYRVTK